MYIGWLQQFQANYPALTSWPNVNPSLDPLHSVQFSILGGAVGNSRGIRIWVPWANLRNAGCFEEKCVSAKLYDGKMTWYGMVW